MNRAIRRGLLAMTVVFYAAGAAGADQLPYFRFNRGTDNPDAIGGGSSLAFQRADTLQSGPDGTPVSASYIASGGTGPYAMSLVNAPAGIALSQVADGSYVAVGTLDPVGSYPYATVHLTDSAGHVVDFPVPVTVTAPGTPQVQALAFDYTDPLPSGVRGTKVRSYYSAKGGRAPYTMTLASAPAGVTFNQAGAIAWEAAGTLDQVGQFQQALVTLTDAAGAQATFPVPLTVTQPSPLAFTTTNDLPPTFPANSQQTASFAVGGGAAPYSWTLSSAPSTVLANGYADGTGLVTGVVDTPGTYSGVTVTVTDSLGATATRVLQDFTVTAGPDQNLDVANLQPPPATMNLYDAFSTNFNVTGSLGPNYSVSAIVNGGPAGMYSAGGFQTSYQTDPASFYLYFNANATGTYDLSILLTDQADTTHQKLVRWGTVTVTQPDFAAVSQFPGPITGTAGTTRTVYARLKGMSGSNVQTTATGPAAVQPYASFQACYQYQPCDPSTGGQTGEGVVALTVTFPSPGTYTGVSVVATDSSGAKIFFDPVDVVSQRPQPFQITQQFPPLTNLQASPYGGAYMDNIYGVFSGGSPNTVATMTSPTGSAGTPTVYPMVNSCSTYSYQCSQIGAAPTDSIVVLGGYVQGVGDYKDLVVTLSDPSVDQPASFAPIEINVAPPPVSNCSFQSMSAMSDRTNTTPNAVTFSGGVAPFQVSASDPAVSYGADTSSNGLTHAFDATIAQTAQNGTVHVTVTDASGGTCAGDVPMSNSTNSGISGIPVVAVSGAYDQYGDQQGYLVASSSTNDFTVEINDYAYGPGGAHPDPMGVVLRFVPSNGASVTGYSLLSSQAPISAPLYGTYPGNPYPGQSVDPTLLYIQNLQNKADFPLPASDYTYTYIVFLSDGTYGTSAPFTTHGLPAKPFVN